MPNCRSWSSGPMPESMSRWGDLIAPALSTTRSASTWNTFPPLSASTPTALPSLIRIFRTNTPPRTVRFRWWRTGLRCVIAVLIRTPSDVVRRRHAEAGGVQAVRVVRGAEPRLHTGGMESLLDGRPRTRLAAPDGHRPVRAMAIIVLNVEITLRFAKVRQDLVIRPFVVAERRPGVEILGEAPLHGLTVDRRPSADHLALRHVDRALAPR